RQGVLFKGGAYLEQLSEVDVVAFDKTGTLTTGDPSLVEVRPSEGWTKEDVLALAAGLEQGSEHHLAQAILDTAREGGVLPVQVEDFQAIPGKGVRGVVPGTEGSVSLGSPEWARELEVPLDEETIASITEDGRTVVLLIKDGEVAGMLAFSDTLRPFAREAVASLEGMRTLLLSGDSRAVAKAVGSNVGISDVYAPLLPEEKVDMVRSFRTRGHKMAMVGDGVNDAPALAEADVGIAMGAVGSDVAMETADVVLLRDDIVLVPRARQLSKRAMRVIRQNIALAIGIKVAVASLVFMGLATLWMAVAIGDMGASLVVILNALRLGIMRGGEHAHTKVVERAPPAVAEPV
ncbi:MAG: HAD-IC family P-type ATPase, partial [Thermoplasmata archaeon]|nr:cation-translocating P-type ATPase [Thermoplasmata archaeon]NIS11542.1 cation-translocating P-type ATPase [Thermoplasmata archaeon]NIS19461.1 cation-translocating P-type ATPase [Thermoplasmata archaeon]NIT76586.1 cation-translocating P-type ATPase [Thermoplasmata archaeon]NIU48578.1 cation-translocating P-type ATPase [Thermoplasmata archaeon]